MDLKFETEGSYKNDDHSWLATRMGLDVMRSITLDLALFTEATHYPDGFIPSGVTLGKVTATSLYGPYAGRASEVQTINLGAATAGTVTIGFDGETTAAIAFNATAATVQTELEKLSNVQAGDIVVTGGPLPGTITLTFGGQYAGKDVSQVVVTPTGLTGGAVTVATTTAGGSATADGRQTMAGHLGSAVEVRATNKTGKAAGALFWTGVVKEARLPTGHGLDAAGKTDANRIRYE